MLIILQGPRSEDMLGEVGKFKIDQEDSLFLSKFLLFEALFEFGLVAGETGLRINE